MTGFYPVRACDYGKGGRYRQRNPDVKCKLYKAFIVPYFRYCSAVWHFCGARNRQKLENLNKRALRIVLDEKSLHYQELLRKLICIVPGVKT